MEISTIDTSEDLAEEYNVMNTVGQDSTVWRMASMLAGSGHDMVFLVTSEGGGVSIKETEGPGCMDAVNWYTLIHIIQAHVDTTGETSRLDDRYIAHVDTFASPRVQRLDRHLIQINHANVVWSHTTTKEWRTDLPYGVRTRSPSQFLREFGETEGTPTFTTSTAQTLTLHTTSCTIKKVQKKSTTA